MRPLDVMIVYAVSMVLLVVVFVIAPNRKKRALQKEMLDGIAAGDTVVTSGGIVATVIAREGDTFVLQLWEGQDCRMRVMADAIHAASKKKGNL